VAAFIAVCPYSVLSYQNFFTDVAFEIHHYGVAGHPGIKPTEQGFEGLKEGLRIVYDSIHWYGVLGAAVGSFAAARRNWRLASVPLVYIVAFLVMMSRQKVQFERNYTSVVAVSLVFTGIGFAYAFAQLQGPVQRMALRRGIARWRLAHLAVVTLAAVLVLSTSERHVFARFRTVPDPRKALVSWANEHMVGKSLYIPSQLSIDLKGIRPSVRVRRYDALGNKEPQWAGKQPHIVVIDALPRNELSKFSAKHRVAPYSGVQEFEGQRVATKLDLMQGPSLFVTRPKKRAH
jgi:hypothetical protein